MQTMSGDMVHETGVDTVVSMEFVVDAVGTFALV